MDLGSARLGQVVQAPRAFSHIGKASAADSIDQGRIHIICTYHPCPLGEGIRRETAAPPTNQYGGVGHTQLTLEVNPAECASANRQRGPRGGVRPMGGLGRPKGPSPLGGHVRPLPLPASSQQDRRDRRCNRTQQPTTAAPKEPVGQGARRARRGRQTCLGLWASRIGRTRGATNWIIRLQRRHAASPGQGHRSRGHPAGARAGNYAASVGPMQD